MLMLVVTIIIAALVSAFAGGLATTAEIRPTVVMEVSYSQSNGLIITNTGSSSTPTDFSVWIRPGEETGMTDYAYEIPLESSKIASAFSTGTSLYVSAATIKDALEEEYGQSRQPWMITCDLDDSRNAIGKSFYVELVDESGTFAKAKGVVQA
ncbi:type IV pilin N-terminal domain-containing protein [Methanorbis furvi]